MRTRCVCSGELCEQRTPPPKRGCTPCSPNSPAVVPMAALSARMALLVIGACHDKKEGRAGIPPFLFLCPPAASASPARDVRAPCTRSPSRPRSMIARYPAPLPCVDYTADRRGLAGARGAVNTVLANLSNAQQERAGQAKQTAQEGAMSVTLGIEQLPQPWIDPEAYPRVMPSLLARMAVLHGPIFRRQWE